MIIRMAFIVLAALVVGHAPARAAKRSMNNITSEIMVRSVEDFVRTGYFYFHRTTTELVDRTVALCDEPSPESLSRARAAFSKTVDAWSQIEMVRFGPIAAENRHERILFHPDPRGTAIKQLQAMFAKGEFPQDLQALQGKSVALQGLPALEYVLFGTGSEGLAEPNHDAAARCSYGALVAENLDQIAREVDDLWADPEGIATIWMNPGLHNPVLRDSREALMELLGVMVHGIETIRDIRLRTFLGEDLARIRPKLALFWRSENTMPSIAAFLDGLQTLFETSGLGLALPADKRAIAIAISEPFARATDLARSLNGPVEPMLADPDQRQRLAELMAVLGELKILLSEDYGNAVGLTAGFSFADGD